MRERGIAGVDIGGGGTRVAVQSHANTVARRITSPLPHKKGKPDHESIARLVSDEVRRAADDLDLTTFSAIAIGMTGLPGRVDDPAQFADAVRARLAVETIILAGDSVTTHIGALGLNPGAVVAAGTGVVALGTDFNELWKQADGWGILLGDEGGGASIGMAGMKAALRAHDGRPLGSTPLLKLMLEAYGNPLTLVRQLYEDPSSASRLASFAPSVAAAARAGDPVAANIWVEAGRHLAQSVATVALRPNWPFSWSGGLFDAGAILLDPFLQELMRLAPGATLIPPAGTSVDGALALARGESDRALETREPYIYVFES